MVAGERQRERRRRAFLAHGPDRERGALRRRDDRGELAHAVHAEVRDRERTALEIRLAELALRHALAQLAQRRGERSERQKVGVGHHRCEHAVGRRHRDRHMRVREHARPLVGVVGVDPRMERQHACHGVHDEVVHRRRLGAAAQPLALREQGRCIDIRHEIEVRDVARGVLHPLGDGTPRRAPGLEARCLGGGGRGRRCRAARCAVLRAAARGALHIFLQDAAVRTAAAQAGQRYAEALGQAAHRRADAHGARVRRRVRRCVRRRGGRCADGRCRCCRCGGRSGRRGCIA